ncbi:MAG: hypothetical protein WCC89_10820, partial [Candidatus Sulfotelmatobacter sp.]
GILTLAAPRFPGASDKPGAQSKHPYPRHGGVTVGDFDFPPIGRARSREAAKECSPRRKPWVYPMKMGPAPEGRQTIAQSLPKLAEGT